MFALLMTAAALASRDAAALTKTISIPFDSSWPGGWGCGDQLRILYSGNYTTSFLGSLPSASKVTRLKLTAAMRRAGQYHFVGDVDPAVSFSIDGQPLGSAVVPNPVLCPFRQDLVQYTFEKLFPDGLSSYATTSWNTLSISVTGGTCPDYCGITFDYVMAQLEVEYTTGYEIAVVSGDQQSGSATGPVSVPLRVRLSTSDPAPQYTGKRVVYTVSQAAGSGATVGVDELATTQVFTADVDSDGYAEAVLVLGNKAGAYTVQASSPLSVTGRVATFTATAVKPSSVVIARDNTTSTAGTYAVSLTQTPKFYSVGMDSAGSQIGRIKCTWSATAASKNGGSATLTPSLSSSSVVAFGPQKLGLMSLTAKPGLSGVSSGSASILIGGILLQIRASFDPQQPIDDLPLFLPGSDINGRSLPVPVPADGTKEIQVLTLHLFTDPGLAGTVKYELRNVSSYPGIAMNWPIAGAGTGKDMSFASGAQSTTISLDSASGDTKTKLYVYDYAAQGQLVATVSASRSTYTIVQQLPADDDGNGLPDRGWPVTGNNVVSQGLAASGDVDASPGTQIGDGVSTFEEYRGFVAATTHQRTDPRTHDIFVVADSQLLTGTVNMSSVLNTLLFPVHYLDLDEVVGEDYPARAIEKVKPVIDPNRANVPGAVQDGQRAVRVVMQQGITPGYRVLIQEPDVYSDLPVAWGGIFAATILESTNPEIINMHTDGTIATTFNAESPNTTRWSEVYDATFANVGIATDFSDPFYYDSAGQPVPPCDQSGLIADCDDFDYDHGLILPHIYVQPDKQVVLRLHSVPHSGDHFSKRVVTCEDPLTLLNGGFTQAEMEVARPIIGAHEAGHSLHIDHGLDCGLLMYNFPGYELIPARSVIDIRPLPTLFTTDEAKQIELHQ